jgi:glyoxylase-like metal-dependent hydrolase (beta-lactamase superfamily II)
MATYSIWVLEYCWVPTAPKGLTVHGAFNGGTVKLPWCYVLIKGGGRTILVDVGYNHKDYAATLAESYGVLNWQPSSVVLAECGVDPHDVTDVFITHAHFDHMGGTDDFPNATFYIQERELSKWVWAMALGKRYRWLMGPTDPGDILRAVDLARQGRLVCVDGDRENVLPGIDLRPAFDTHTWGSMYVHVRNDGKQPSADGYILAGDLVYTYENLTGPDPADPRFIPIGLAAGSQTNLMLSSHEMLTLVDDETRRVIPIHDEKLPTIFPSRVTSKGLTISEICLGERKASRVA